MKKLWKLECVQQLTSVEGKCDKPIRIVVNRHAKRLKKLKVGKTTIKVYPSEYAKDGLCYYHWKKKKGLLTYGSPFKSGGGRKW